MTYEDVFGQFRPFAIGFDSFFDDLNRTQIQQHTYPPYNVIKLDAENFCIEIACAGFGKKDISIEKEKNTLTIEASKDKTEKDFVHKGLAQRAFRRSFTLADDVEVTGAKVTDGILNVDLVKVVPEEDKPISIKIA